MEDATDVSLPDERDLCKVQRRKGPESACSRGTPVMPLFRQGEHYGSHRRERGRDEFTSPEARDRAPARLLGRTRQQPRDVAGTRLRAGRGRTASDLQSRVDALMMLV